MNYCSDMDVFTGWGEAVVKKTLSQKTERRYNAGVIFKRAQGQGHIQRIEGLRGILGRHGDHIVSIDLRHPDLGTLMEMLDRIGTDLQIHAG